METKKRNANLALKLLIALALFIGLWSCQKDDYKEPVKPEILSLGVSAPDTSISKGRDISFISACNIKEVKSYSWTVNNKEVSKDNSYTFVGQTSGVYTISLAITTNSGEASKNVTVYVHQHLGGLYIVNEGWFRHEIGSVNHYDPETKTITERVYQSANTTDNDVMSLGVTTQYGVKWQGKLFFVSKGERNLVVADALTLKDIGSIESMENSSHAFCGIDKNRGVLTTADGAYIVNITGNISLGNMIEGTDGACGDIWANEDYLFIANQDKGAIILSVKDNFRVLKTIPEVGVGFVQSKDGDIWCSKNDNILVNIKLSDLSVTETILPAGLAIYESWGTWKASTLCVSNKQNALYFTNGKSYATGNKIYKYVIGDITSLSAPFAVGTDDDSFYGASIRVNPENDNIVATFTKDGWGDSYKDNRLVFFSGETGAELERKLYNHYWFPSLILFN